MSASPPPPSDPRDDAAHSGAGAPAPAFDVPSPAALRRPGRRAWMIGGVAAVVAVGFALVWRKVVEFPPDTTPEGAYLRVAAMLGEGDARGCFSYLEDAAQHAAYTVRDYRKKASDRVAAAYPEPERARLLDAYRPLATAPDGADVWVELGARRGWVARLRRDLTGVARVETSGDRATIETTGGTRYAFRRRGNGMWGLSMFTAELVAEAERAARDFEVVDRAAADYERAR
jgi:hypothetical protein